MSRPHWTVARLWDEIASKGLRCEDVAYDAGGDKSRLYRYLRGQALPRLDKLEALLAVVGLKIAIVPDDTP